MTYPVRGLHWHYGPLAPARLGHPPALPGHGSFDTHTQKHGSSTLGQGRIPVLEDVEGDDTLHCHCDYLVDTSNYYERAMDRLVCSSESVDNALLQDDGLLVSATRDAVAGDSGSLLSHGFIRGPI